MIRTLTRGAGVLLLIVTLYLTAAALGGLVPGRTADIPADTRDTTEIALLFGPIHVDFLLPATPETRRALQFARAGGVTVDDPATGYFIVGWGARDFYTTTPEWADMTVRATARAVTGDASVVRVDTVPTGARIDTLPRLHLSPTQYTALLAEIAATVPDGAPGIEVRGQRPTSGFVEARGRFNILRTCNTWVGRVLRAAGVPVGQWTPTPYSLRLSLLRMAQF